MRCISAVAHEAAHCYMRKLSLGAIVLITLFILWRMDGIPAVSDEAIHFPPEGRLGNGIKHVFPYGKGGVIRGS